LNRADEKPTTPEGFVLRECLDRLSLTIAQAAAALGVTRKTLSKLVNEKCGISPEMAVKLEKVFDGSEEGWLLQQSRYDLAHARRDLISFSGWN
jgi:addiction module HigA family antidote